MSCPDCQRRDEELARLLAEPCVPEAELTRRDEETLRIIHELTELHLQQCDALKAQHEAAQREIERLREDKQIQAFALSAAHGHQEAAEVRAEQAEAQVKALREAGHAHDDCITCGLQEAQVRALQPLIACLPLFKDCGIRPEWIQDRATRSQQFRNAIAEVLQALATPPAPAEPER